MKIVCYLNFNGNCEEAFEFYKEALGGEIFYIQRYGESPVDVSDNYKNKILHLAYRFRQNELYASDTFEGQAVKPGDNMALNLEPESEEQLDQIYEKLSRGGKILMPLQKTFWNAKFASFVDKFGINWMLNFELKE
jgi:PhnB protein